MSKVFDNGVDSSYNITCDGMVVSFAKATTGKPAALAFPVYMSNVQVNFQRNISPVTAVNLVNNQRVNYNIVGQPTGSLSCSGVLAPDPAGLDAFLEAVSKTYMTTKDNITFTLSPRVRGEGGKTQKATSYTIKNMQLVTFGFTSDSQSNILNHSLSFIFTNMEITAPESSNEGPVDRLKNKLANGLENVANALRGN